MSESNKGHYPTVTSQFGEFSYIRKEHVENNLFVKYYVRVANFNKVIMVLNIKSAVNLLLTSARGANRDNAFDCEIFLSAFSRLRFPLEPLQFYT